MALLSRWLRPPSEFRKLLQGQERVLGIADTPAGEFVIVTQNGLYPPAGDGWRLIRWSDVVKASWTDGGLNVVEGDLDDERIVIDRLPLRIELTEPRNVPAVVRTRVETSIARTEQVNVPGGTARIVARRIPGIDGITWTARLDTGTPDSPQAREMLLRYLHQIEISPVE